MVHKFRQCNGCQEVFYCSRSCQKLDWKYGRHRQECFQAQNNRLGMCICSFESLSEAHPPLDNPAACPMSEREAALHEAIVFRTLAHNAYDIHKLLASHEKPGPPVIQLDFTKLPVKITAEGVLPSEQTGKPSPWNFVDGDEEEIRLRVIYRAGPQYITAHMVIPHRFKAHDFGII